MTRQRARGRARAVAAVVAAATATSCTLFGVRVGPCTDARADKHVPAAEHSTGKAAVARYDQAKGLLAGKRDLDKARKGQDAADECQTDAIQLTSMHFQACEEKWKYDSEKEPMPTSDGTMTLAAMRDKCRAMREEFHAVLKENYDRGVAKRKAEFAAALQKLNGDRAGVFQELGYPNESEHDSDGWMGARIWSFRLMQYPQGPGAPATTCDITFVFDGDKLTRTSAMPATCYAPHR